MQNKKIKNIWTSITEFRCYIRRYNLKEPNYNNVFFTSKDYETLIDTLLMHFQDRTNIFETILDISKMASNEKTFINIVGNTITDDIESRIILKGMWMWWDNVKEEIKFRETLGLRWSEKLDKKYGVDGFIWDRDKNMWRLYQFKNKGFNQTSIDKYKNSCKKLSNVMKTKFKFILVFNSNNNVKNIEIAGVYYNFDKNKLK